MDRDQSVSGKLTPGFAIWFTGLPASGKTALAREFRLLLAAQAIHAVVLDSDDLRAVLTPQPRYTEAERDWVYAVVVYLATWLTQGGVNVLIAATANRRAYRDQARSAIERFAEVYVRCPLAVCQARDPKGIYRQALHGQAATVPGVGSDYEPPLQPEAIIDTADNPAAESAAIVFAHLQRCVRGDAPTAREVQP